MDWIFFFLSSFAWDKTLTVKRFEVDKELCLFHHMMLTNHIQLEARY